MRADSSWGDIHVFRTYVPIPLYPFRRVCQGGGRPKPPSAREVAARSAGGGRDVTRFFSPPVGCADSPLTEGALQRGSAVIPTPVTVSLAWESVLSFVGKRIAAPVCTPRALASRRGLARNDKVRRGGRLCPPRMTTAPCRAGPMCPAAEHRICPGGAHGPRPTRRQHRFSAQKKKALAGFLFLHLE